MRLKCAYRMSAYSWYNNDKTDKSPNKDFDASLSLPLFFGYYVCLFDIHLILSPPVVGCHGSVSVCLSVATPQFIRCSSLRKRKQSKCSRERDTSYHAVAQPASHPSTMASQLSIRPSVKWQFWQYDE